MIIYIMYNWMSVVDLVVDECLDPGWKRPNRTWHQLNLHTVKLSW